MKRRPTLHSSGVHRLPEGRSAWQLDDATIDRARTGIALARAALDRARSGQAQQLSTDAEHLGHATAA